MKISKYLNEKRGDIDSVDMTKVSDFIKFAKIFGYDDGRCCGVCKFVAGSSTGRYYFCENEDVKQKISTDEWYIDEITVDPTSVCKYFKAK